METTLFPFTHQDCQAEAGKLEVSCVLDDSARVVMARPIFSDETRPTHFTFANQVAVQTEDERIDGSTPDELTRTIQSYLWLANLEMSSGTTPTMSSTSKLPRQPHPDGPTIMTWHQLEHAQNAIVEAHKAGDVSSMLKGVVSNMHLLAKLSREAGFLPYIGHAHYIYECYLKSQINSSRPPSGCDLSQYCLVPSSGFGQGHASGMFPGHETIFVTTRPEWHYVSCHSSALCMHYCGCDKQIHSVVAESDESEVPVISDERATAWEALIPSVPARADPNQAPTEVPFYPECTRRGDTYLRLHTLSLIKETHLQRNMPLAQPFALREKRI